jgi:alginate O-acetyltransferase complex protein AlgI
MPFPTVAFAVFFVAAFTVNWLLRPHVPVWRATMVAFSLYFCGWVDARFVLIVVGSAIVNWAFALAVYRAMPEGRPTPRSRRLVAASVVANLAALGVFKYHGFFVESVADALATVGLHPTPPVLDLLVPVGISFFTLHAISYVVDVGRRDIEPISFGDLLLYMSFFPHLVAGPIVRVDELVPQFHARPDPRRLAAADAFALIGVGLFKTVVVSSYLAAHIVDPVYRAPGAHSGSELLAGTYAYAIQIYADFSGYTDIAIGCALLLGVRLPRNFDAPYRALSVREFWQRWHITLSRWLRDYVYIPLGGSRRTASTTGRNLMATMLIGGLWHGAGWTFVIWGGLHGTFLVGERAAAALSDATGAVPAAPRTVSVVLRWALTFNLVCVAWVFFRADSPGVAVDVLGRIARWDGGPSTLITVVAVLTVGAALLSQLVPDHRTRRLRSGFSTLSPATQAAVLAAGLTVIGVLGPDSVAPLYFPF